jgi:hypothetical protein
MLRKLAIAAAAAAIVASAGLAVDSASAEIIWPRHGGGGGSMHFAPHGFAGGGGSMHFAPRSFGGGGVSTHFAPYGFGGSGFAGPRFFRPGGFVRHFGAGQFALGRSFGGASLWGRPAAHYAAFGRFASATPYQHSWYGSYRHGRYGWRDYRRGYVGWGGPVFWPYAYDDEFDYAFSPYGPYDDLFWSYGYDDLFAGVLLPYAYAGLEGGAPPAQSYAAPAPQSGATPFAGAPPSQSASQLCVSARSLAGGAATDPIAKAVQPNADQSAKLDALKNAEADAQKTLAASCAAHLPTTAVGRLDAVQTRLQAMIQAANAVGGPLNDFYASLTDEQKAAFNALGQNGQAANAAGAPSLAQLCGPQNAVPVIAVDQIDGAVQPDAKQQTSLAALRDAAGKADDAILASCPKQAPLTPTGRLDAVKARLQAMANGVDLIKPPLQDFYASLSDEQKARFDALTQPPAASEPTAKAP